MLWYCRSLCQRVGRDSGTHNSGCYLNKCGPPFVHYTLPLQYLENRHVSPTFSKNKVRMYKNYLKKSCNYIFEIIKSCNYIFVSYLCCYFARTTNTCTNIITLQYELDIYIHGSNTVWRGWGSCSETLPYSKFRHISWEQMMTEHRGLSVQKNAPKNRVCPVNT